MNIDCCIRHSTKSLDTFENFSRYKIKQIDAKTALKNWLKVVNSIRKKEGKARVGLMFLLPYNFPKANFVYTKKTKAANRKLDYDFRIEVYSIFCKKCGCLKLKVLYYLKTQKKPFVQELSGDYANLFLVGIMPYSQEVVIPFPGERIISLKKHPGFYPKLEKDSKGKTDGITGGFHSMVEACGWGKRKSFICPVVNIKSLTDEPRAKIVNL